MDQTHNGNKSPQNQHINAQANNREFICYNCGKPENIAENARTNVKLPK